MSFLANSQILELIDPRELPVPKELPVPIELYDYHAPEVPENVVETQFSEHGGVHTPQGELKVLLVFAQFEGDIFDKYNENWPTNSLPNFNDVLYTDINQFDPGNTDFSLSNFYYQMSIHSADPFKMYGEVFPELVIVPRPTTNYSFSHFTNQVFDYIEDNYSDYDWPSLDNRTNWPNFVYDNTSSDEDYKFDYVVISFRWNGRKTDPWSTETADSLLWWNFKQSWGNASGWAAIAGQTLNTDYGTYYVHWLSGVYLPERINQCSYL